MVTPIAAEQPAPAGKEAPKDKDAPAPSKEGAPQPDKDEKQTAISGMGDPAPRWKSGGFYRCPGWGDEGQAPRKRLRPRTRASRRIKRRMRPSPAGAAHPRLTRRPPTRPSRNLGTKCPKANRLLGKALLLWRRPRLEPSSRPSPRDAARGVKEEIVYLNLSELHPFQKSSLWCPGRC